MKPSPIIAYILGEFPSISETFVYAELMELVRRGLTPVIFALTRAINTPFHVYAEMLLPLVLYPPDSVFLHQEGWRRYFHPQAINRFMYSAPVQNISLLWRAKTHFPGHFFLSAWVSQECVRLGISRLHAHFPEPSLVAMLASLRTGMPFSFTVHSHLVTESNYWLEERVKYARNVIAISNHCKREIVALTRGGYQKKIAVIPCGLDVPRHLGLMKRIKKVRKNPGFPIIAIGRLVEQKGFSYLIGAIALARKSCPNITLTIVGDGPLRAPLHKMINSLKLNRFVTLLGSMTHDQNFARLLLTHRVFVLPCVTLPNHDQDGLPVAILEAMLYGLPIITTSVGALRDIISPDVGIFVPEKDALSLARAIKRLYDQPRRALQSMGQKGQMFVCNNYSISQTILPLHNLLTL